MLYPSVSSYVARVEGDKKGVGGGEQQITKYSGTSDTRRNAHVQFKSGTTSVTKPLVCTAGHNVLLIQTVICLYGRGSLHTHTFETQQTPRSRYVPRTPRRSARTRGCTATVRLPDNFTSTQAGPSEGDGDGGGGGGSSLRRLPQRPRHPPPGIPALGATGGTLQGTREEWGGGGRAAGPPALGGCGESGAPAVGAGRFPGIFGACGEPSGSDKRRRSLRGGLRGAQSGGGGRRGDAQRSRRAGGGGRALPPSPPGAGAGEEAGAPPLSHASPVQRLQGGEGEAAGGRRGGNAAM